jgi:hypothetical protein
MIDFLLRLTIPMPPTGTNHAYVPRVVHRGGGKMGASLMHSKEHATWESGALKAMVDDDMGVEWFINPTDFDPKEALGLAFSWYFKDRRSDLDSRHKLVKDLVFDYLTARTGMKCNDREVSGDINDRHYYKTNPHVFVTVRTLDAHNARYHTDAER